MTQHHCLQGSEELQGQLESALQQAEQLQQQLEQQQQEAADRVQAAEQASAVINPAECQACCGSV